MKLRRSFLALTAMLCAVAIWGCVRMPAWTFERFTGHVVEQGTGQPISGAIVLGLWEETRGSLAHSTTLCVRAETAVTDTRGNYGVPKVRGDNPNRFYVYKPGYVFDEQVHFDPLSSMRNPVLLQPFSGTGGARLGELSRLYSRTSCIGAAETGTKGNELPLLKAMYEEARGVAQTREDQDMAERLLWGIEEIEFGNKVATERSLERSKGRK